MWVAMTRLGVVGAFVIDARLSQDEAAHEKVFTPISRPLNFTLVQSI
jgi:hypothetical protein